MHEDSSIALRVALRFERPARNWVQMSNREVRDQCASLQQKYRSYQQLGKGRGRVTYKVSPRNVMKIPLDINGVNMNFKEWDLYRQYGKSRDPKGIVYAACRVVMDQGIPCLLMEYAKPTGLSTAMPEWPDWVNRTDARQVGRDSKGRLVVYDYGD
jgi:hypothetical protein